jgi:dihydrolipoamide dehydrogenase
MADQYDVVVLGAGPGGYVAAIRAAQLGLRTAVVERQYMGGVCLNIGCIPTKALLKNAEVAHTLQHRAKEFGFSFDNLKLDYPTAFKRSRQVSDRLVKGVSFLMKKNKIDVYDGTGTLTGPNTMAVKLNDGKEATLSAKNIIIATGARPRPFPGVEFDEQRIISYIPAILADKPPKSVIIIGGGAIGVEFAYVWANYGVDVTILEMMPHLLPNEEPEVSDTLEKAYKKLGVKFQTNARVTGIEKSDNGVRVQVEGGQPLEAEQCMVAINFLPNTEGIGLEAAGVQLTERKNIAIDGNMRTNVPGVYAIGDVATDYRLAHVASAMGLIAAETIAGHHTTPLDFRMMPRCTYSQPQVASFGYTEAAGQGGGLRDQGRPVPVCGQRQVAGAGRERGLREDHQRRQYGEILGAHWSART